MSEEKKNNGCLIWFLIIVGIVLLALVITWYVVNDGWKGSLSGTYAKLTARSEIAPSEDLQPNFRPEVRPPSTEPTDPGQEQPDQEGMDIKPPVYGMPGLGLPNPLEALAPKTTTPTAPGTELGQQGQQGQQPLESLGSAGAALTPPTLQSPSDVLKACVDLLKSYDIIGAEKYVSPNGLGFTLGTTTGVHEVLWKGLYQVQAYQSVGYDAIITSGQTALVPLYASLGDKKVTVAYIVMAHRGDGWKLDHITDPGRF